MEKKTLEYEPGVLVREKAGGGNGDSAKMAGIGINIRFVLKETRRGETKKA